MKTVMRISNIVSGDRVRLIRLAFTNIVPLIGVLFFDWSLFAILFYYWLENGIIGFFNVWKMIIGSFRQKNQIGFILVPFFCVHFGGFMFGHFFMLTGFFIERDPIFERFDGPSWFLFWLVVVNMLPIFFGYLLAFIDFVKNKSATARLDFLFFSPYPRIMVMHITLLVGGFLIMALHQPAVALLILILVKSCMEYVANKIKFN